VFAVGGVVAAAAVAAAAYWWFSPSSSRHSEKKETKRQESKESKHSVAPKFSKGSRVSTSFGPGTVESYRAEDSIYTVVLDVEDVETPPNRMHVTEDQLHPFNPKYGVGAKVQTAYGPGIIESYRDDDRIYGVKYVWDDNGSAVGYLNGSAIQPYVESHEIKLHTIPVSERKETFVPLGAKFPTSGSEDDVKLWLAGEDFDEPLQERLKGYTGAQLFAESKKELVASLGYREADRLWNLLHPAGSENKDSAQGDRNPNQNNSLSSGNGASKPESNQLGNEEDDEEEEEDEEGAPEHS